MRLIRKIGFPISLMYGVVIHIRNYFYDVGLFKSKAFETPTICIGNLSVGGTGKTPMAEFLISLLRNKYQIAFLSRGYRRNSSGFQLADSQSTVGQLGDEPYQIHAKFKGISVAVDADRRNGIHILEEEIAPDLILLDDAFQHRRVHYGLSILLTAYKNLYVDDYFVPLGDLRDSRRQALRADLIIVTKCPPNLTDSEREVIRQKLRPRTHQDVLFSYLDYGKVLHGDSLSQNIQKLNRNKTSNDIHPCLALKDLADKKITLVTGIADPSPLVVYLKDLGLAFEHLLFKDHHSFTPRELTRLKDKEVVLTTEKDYMRLQGKLKNLFYLEIQHKFIADGKNRLQGRIQRFMETKSSE